MRNVFAVNVEITFTFSVRATSAIEFGVWESVQGTIYSIWQKRPGHLYSIKKKLSVCP